MVRQGGTAPRLSRRRRSNHEVARFDNFDSIVRCHRFDHESPTTTESKISVSTPSTYQEVFIFTLKPGLVNTILSTIALVSDRLHDGPTALLSFGLQLRQLRSAKGVCRLWHCKLLFQRVPALGLETTQAVLRTMSSLQGFCKSVDDGAKGVFGSTLKAHASSNS